MKLQITNINIYRLFIQKKIDYSQRISKALKEIFFCLFFLSQQYLKGGKKNFHKQEIFFNV